MLLTRSRCYNATRMDTLYHYCSTKAFAAIVRDQSIWLSSLSLSNDTMEGRLVNRTVMLLAERDGLDIPTLARLQESVGFMEGMFDGLGFCLSEEGDLLSQWRGYADDAKGVSVGFSRAYLEELANLSKGNETPGFALRKVEYDLQMHEAKIEPTYRELRKLIDAGAFKQSGARSLLDTRTEGEIAEEDKQIEKARNALFLKLLELFPRLFELKASAFKEEREWRLVSILARDLADECLHRTAGDRIIPYRVFALPSSNIPAIAEVVLGPKHQTPPQVVKSMLKLAGFGEVKVSRSVATYR